MNFSWTAINSAKNLIMINIKICWLNCLYLRLQRKWVQKFVSYHFSIPHPEEIQCSRSYSNRCQMPQTLLIITEPSALHPIMITKWYKFLSLIHNLYKRKKTKHTPCQSISWILISCKFSVFKPNLLHYPNLVLNTSIINETKN